MPLHRVRAESGGAGDELVAVARRQMRKHFQLAFGEVGQGRVSGRGDVGAAGLLRCPTVVPGGLASWRNSAASCGASRPAQSSAARRRSNGGPAKQRAADVAALPRAVQPGTQGGLGGSELALTCRDIGEHEARLARRQRIGRARCRAPEARDTRAPASSRPSNNSATQDRAKARQRGADADANGSAAACIASSIRAYFSASSCSTQAARARAPRHIGLVHAAVADGAVMQQVVERLLAGSGESLASPRKACSNMWAMPLSVISKRGRPSQRQSSSARCSHSQASSRRPAPIARLQRMCIAAARSWVGRRRPHCGASRRRRSAAAAVPCRAFRPSGRGWHIGASH